MSVNRRYRQITVFRDESGKERETSAVVKSPPGLGGIDRSSRLVDVHDSQGHFVAALVSNGDGAGLVYLAGHPGPVYELGRGIFAPVIVNHGVDERWIVTALPGGLAQTDAPCSVCRLTHTLRAGDLEAALLRAKPRRPGRVIVGVS